MLAACDRASEPASAATASPLVPSAPAAGRVIEIEANDSGFVPSTVEAKRGEPIVLRFKRTTKSECLKAVQLPELKIAKDLPMNVAVDIPLTPDKEGEIAFQCWMAMMKGTIVVRGS